MWNLVLFAVGACAVVLNGSAFVSSVCSTILCMNSLALIIMPAGRTLELDVDSSLLAANLVTAQFMSSTNPPQRPFSLLSLLFFPLGPLALWIRGVSRRCKSATCSVLGGRMRRDFARLIVCLQVCMLLVMGAAFRTQRSPVVNPGSSTFHTPVFGFAHRFGSLHQLATALHGATGAFIAAGGIGAMLLFVAAARNGRLQLFPLAYAELYSVTWLIHGFFGTIMGARRMLHRGLVPPLESELGDLGFPPHILLMFGMLLTLVGSHAVRILLGAYDESHRKARAMSFAASSVSVATIWGVVCKGALLSAPGSAWRREYGSSNVPPLYMSISAFWLFEVANAVVLCQRGSSPRLTLATAWMSMLVMAATGVSTALNLLGTKYFKDDDVYHWLLVGPWVGGWCVVAAAGCLAWRTGAAP